MPIVVKNKIAVNHAQGEGNTLLCLGKTLELGRYNKLELDSLNNIEMAHPGFVLENGHVTLNGKGSELLYNEHLKKPIWEFKGNSFIFARSALSILPSMV